MGLLDWYVSKLPPVRVIANRMGTGPYLSRWYVKGHPYMADGSNPFNDKGETMPNVIWPRGVGVLIHKFHESDDQDFHNHPFQWALSFILVAGYDEERLQKDGTVKKRRVRPWTFNFIRANDFHRVDLSYGTAWTLFITGPKIQNWGFWVTKIKKYLPWRNYIDAKRAGEL